MKIIKYKPEQKAKILSDALLTLLSGGTVVYPTETAYALGADFYSPDACRQIFRIKNRSPKKQLPVLVPNLKYATTLVKFSHSTMLLADRYWPGPLTLVLPFLHGNMLPHHGDSSLALRVSSNSIAASLASSFGRPLVSTSANISGSRPMYNIKDVIKQWRRGRYQPDLVIDAGNLKEVPASTIVKDVGGRLEVVRSGPIKIET